MTNILIKLSLLEMLSDRMKENVVNETSLGTIFP